MDFEADLINKSKTLIKKLLFSISESIKFPFITQWRYCQKLDFEADPINKFTTLIKNYYFRFQNQLYKFPFITQLKFCQKLDFEASP